MEFFPWIFAVLGFLLGALLTFAFFIPHALDAARYRWLRDHPAAFVADSEISRWLLRRPWGAAGMDALVDAGMGKARRAAIAAQGVCDGSN